MTYDRWKTTDRDDDFLGPKPFLCERCGAFCEPDKDAASKGWLCEECMNENTNPFARILEQLAWRGANGRTMGRVVLVRKEAEALVARLAAPRCRFGCDTPVVGVYWMPEGCACWRDPVQALCAQHATKAEPIGDMILICGPGLP